VKATFDFGDWKVPEVFANPSYLAGVVVMVALGWALIQIPLKNAGDPNEPAPPAAIM
jgi:hypothetical protein